MVAFRLCTIHLMEYHKKSSPLKHEFSPMGIATRRSRSLITSYRQRKSDNMSKFSTTYMLAPSSMQIFKSPGHLTKAVDSEVWKILFTYIYI